jgi:hypothetical protein
VAPAAHDGAIKALPKEWQHLLLNRVQVRQGHALISGQVIAQASLHRLLSGSQRSRETPAA